MKKCQNFFSNRIVIQDRAAHLRSHLLPNHHDNNVLCGLVGDLQLGPYYSDMGTSLNIVVLIIEAQSSLRTPNKASNIYTYINFYMECIIPFNLVQQKTKQQQYIYILEQGREYRQGRNNTRHIADVQTNMIPI